MKKWTIGILLLFVAVGLIYNLYPGQTSPNDTKIDKLIVTKSTRIMEAYARGGYNWTAGCIAVTDAEIDELLGAVEKGTPIIFNP